jgi:hypothetical protein
MFIGGISVGVSLKLNMNLPYIHIYWLNLLPARVNRLAEFSPNG